jgi:hypothetical protein
MVSRAIDYRLQWNTNNQNVIFGGENHSWLNRDLHIQETVVDRKTAFEKASLKCTCGSQ